MGHVQDCVCVCVCVCVCRADKDRQQLVIEIDSISTALDSANKAKVQDRQQAVLALCVAFHSD